MNVDKLIISYRILKSLKLDAMDDDCTCESCKLRKKGKHGFYSRFEENSNKKQLRDQLYVMKSKNKGSDNVWETGFSIELEE